MKNLLLLFTLFVIGCMNRPNDFGKYTSQLKTLTTPLVFETIKYSGNPASKNYDQDLFERFKLKDAQSVYGKLYSNDKTTGIIYTVAGDIAVPVLVTYDNSGNKIDSMNLFSEGSGVGEETETYVRATLLPDFSIHVVDSTVKASTGLEIVGHGFTQEPGPIQIDSTRWTVDYRRGIIYKGE